MKQSKIVDELLELYDKINQEKHMQLAIAFDDAYRLIEQYPNQRMLLRRCMEKAERDFDITDLEKAKYWIDKLFESNEVYNRV